MTERNRPRHTERHRFRQSESGNVFFTLFGAVAIVGVLGAGIMATMRGPLTTMVNVQKKATAEAQMGIAAKLAILEAASQANSGDCDADQFVEPMQYDTAIVALGGGTLPAAVGSNRQDPWGSDYGYCAWDAGTVVSPDIGNCTNTLLAGNDTNDEDYPMIVIVSAGPDRTFQTTCDAYSGTGLTKGGDDIVMDYTYETASASVDGLWRIKSGEPDTAEIDKQLFVSGGARFTSAINLTAPSAQLQLGAASMLFPTQADLATCNAANNQLLRVNTATAPITLEICDFANGGWQSVSAGAGSIWQLGAGDDIYYSSGTTPQVGIGNNSPTEALDVTGNIQLSGNVAFSSAGSRVGWSSGADITESAGDLLIDANGGSGVEVTVGADSLDIAGDTVITGTTSGVTTIDALTVENVLGTDILNVQNNGNVGIGVADPTERLDVGGSITATDHYKLDGTNILTDNSAAGTVLLGKSAGSLTSGNYNTILGSGAAGTLSTGTGNIIVGSGATAPDVPAGATSNYLNIGDLIYGDIAGNRVGINQAAGVDVTTFDDTLEVAGTIDASGNINSDATVIGANVTTTGRVTTNELYVQNTDNFIPGNCAAGSFHRWDGNSWECEADTGGVGGGTQDLDSVLTQGSDANFQSAGNFSGIAIGSNTFSTGAQTLELDVTGDVGATYYCDAAGNNCFTAASITGGTGIGAPGSNREVIFNSNGVLGADTNFVFTSTGQLGIGTNAPGADLAVNTISTGSIGQIIKWGAAGQTGNLLQFQNNAGTVLGAVRADGSVSFPLVSTASGIGYATFGNAARLDVLTLNGSFKVDSTGNVGIRATGAPAAELDIGGTGALITPRGDTSQRPGTPVNGMIRYNSQTGKFEGYQAGAWTDIITAGASAAAPDRGIQFNSGGSFAADANFVFTSTGNLGLGTSTPSRKLDVNGYIQTDSSSGGFLLGPAGSAGILGNGYNIGTDYLVFNTGFVERMRITATGNVGIGTNAPQAQLDIAGTGAMITPRGTTAQRPGTAVNGMIRYNSQTGKFEGYQAGAWTDIITAGATAAAPDRGVQFNSGGSFAAESTFTYTSAGYLGIGTATPGYPLSVNGRIETRGGMLFNQGTSATDNLIYVGSGTPGDVNASFGFFVGGVGSGNNSDGPYFLARGNSFSNIGNQRGNMYFEAGNIGGAAASEGSLNFVTGAELLRMIINKDGYVGIGDATPDSGTGGQLMLDVNGNIGGTQYCDASGNNCFTAASVVAGSVFEDSSGTGAGPIRSTSGTINYASADFVFGSPQLADTGNANHDARMFFDKSKAAFRTGEVSGGHWDDANVGWGSIASGWNSTASGTNSVAMGDGNIASGANSVALGNGSDVSGNNAFAMGQANVARGNYSLATGYNNEATGEYGITMGNQVRVGNGSAGSGFGDGSMALGLIDEAVTITSRPRVSGIQSLGIFMGDQDGVDVTASNLMALLGGRLVIDPDTTSATNTNVSTGAQQLELDVTGDIGAVNYCDEAGNNCFTAASVATGVAPGNDREMIFNSGGVLGTDTNFVFTSAGYLGIGTTTPTADLDVSLSGDGAINLGNNANGNYGYEFLHRDDLGMYKEANSFNMYISSLADLRVNIDSNNNDVGSSFSIGGNGNGMTGGTQLFTVLDTGNVGIGTTAPWASLQVDRSGSEASYAQTTYAANAGDASYIYFGRSRGTSATPTAVQSGDEMALITSGGYTGSQWDDGASIRIVVDGAVGANDLPTQMEFSTTPDGSDTAAVRMAIDNSGFIGVGTATPQAELDIAGTGAMITPRGDTSQRPGTAVNGMLRYNSQTGKFEGYQAGAWQDILTSGGGTGAIDDLSDAFTDYATEHNIIMGRAGAAALTAGAAGNLFIGENAGATTANSTAATDSNVAVGISALRQLTSGTLGTAVGAYALRNNTSGQFNTALGAYALFTNTNNGSNTAIGYNALYNNTAAGITAMGYSALTDNTTGNDNVAVGYSALATNKAGTGGTAVGYQAMRYANDTTTATTTYNTALGAYALRGSTTAANNTGTSNTALGYGTLASATAGAENTAIGDRALQNTTTADGSTGVGKSALNSNDSANYNTALGAYALYAANGAGANNTAVGYQAGNSITTGASNILIGYDVDTPTATTSNYLNIGGAFYGDMATGNMTLAGTAALTLPRGTTAERPGTAVNGMIRYNSQTGKFEGYQAGVWTDIITAGGTAAAPDRGIQFNSGGAFTADSTFVYTSTGQLGLGTATPATGYELDVNGELHVANNIHIGATSGGGGYLNVLVNNGNTSGFNNLLDAHRDGGAYNGVSLGYLANGTTDTAGAISGNLSGSDLALLVNAGGTPTERMRIANSGNVGIGTSSPGALLHLKKNTTDNYGEVLEVEGDGEPAVSIQSSSANSALNPIFWTARSRGTTAAKTIVANNDSLFELQVQGYGGTANRDAAYIEVAVDGTPGASDMPGRIEFHTQADGAGANLENSTPEMVIKNSGDIGIGTGSPATLLHLHKPAGSFPKLRMTAADVTLPNFSTSNSLSDVSATNTIGQFRNGMHPSTDANQGGFIIQGFTGSGVTDQFPLRLVGTHGASGATSTAAVTISGQKWNGTTNRAALGTGEIVLDVETRYADVGNGSAAPLLRVTGDGNVGIGTTTPQAQLDIAGTGALITPRGDTSQRPGTAVNGMIRYNSQTGKFEGYQAGVWTDIITAGGTAAAPDRGVQFNSGGAFTADSTFVYTSTGYLGIGTAAPTNPLEVNGVIRLKTNSTNTDDTLPNNSDTQIVIQNTSTSDNVVSSIVFNEDANQHVGALSVQTTSNASPTGRMYFYTRGTAGFVQRMVIDEEGRVGLGGTGGLYVGTAYNPAYLLTLDGDSAAQTIGMSRESTNLTAGRNLTILAGGGDAGSNNNNGGNLVLQSGITTGNGSSSILFQTVDANQGTGSTDRSPATTMTLGSTRLVVAPPASAAVAGAATITADACGTIKQITSVGNVTTNTTDTFTAPTASYAGCCMDVVNVDTADTITLDSNAKFLTGAGTDIALAPNKAVRVCSDGTNWYQAAAVSSVAAGGSTAIDDLSDAYTDYGASSNFIMGRTSAAALTAGAEYNTFVGEGTGATTANSSSTTDRNTALGYQALTSLTDGDANTAVGETALRANTTGIYNVGLGAGALYSNTTGGENIAIGTISLAASAASVLESNTTGSKNVAIGGSALAYNTTKQESTAIGHNAMLYADSAAGGAVTGNTAVGAYALRGSTTAANNTGTSNTAIGHSALRLNTSGQENTAVGVTAMDTNSTGQLNTAVGFNTMYFNDTGSSNTAIGNGALTTNVAKSQSTAVGYYAMHYADSGAAATTYNTAVGYQALRGSTTAANNTGTNNTAIGHSSLDATTSGEYNTAMGANSLGANTTGSYNVAIGPAALLNSVGGNRNTAVGEGALYTGVNNTDDNTAIGKSALELVDGSDFNVALGSRAGDSITTGASNIMIGYDANPPTATTSNYLNIGGAFYGDMATGNMTLAGTAALTLPRGDTSQRPGTAVNGMLRYNSQSGKFEGYQAGVWTDIITAGGTAASPDRGIQFNSGGSFAADANFVYTSTGNLGIGTSNPQFGLSLIGDFEFGNGFDAGYLRAGTDYIGLGRNSNGLDLTIDQATGNVGIGTGTTAPTNVLEVASDTNENTLALTVASNSSGEDPNINLMRSKGTLAAKTTVASGDNLGAIWAFGHDGTNMEAAAAIEFEVDGGVATAGDTTDMPGNIQFLTTPDGTDLPVERMRITNAGNVGIGTTAPSTKLHLRGDGEYGIQMTQAAASDAHNPYIWSYRSKGTVASPTAVDVDAILMEQIVSAHDGTGYISAGHTAFVVDGTPGTNDMPTRYEINVQADGAGSWMGDGASTPEFVIKNNGAVGIGMSSPASKFVVAPPSSEAIAGAAVITADACGTIKQITSVGNQTTNTTDTFTAPTASYAGCCMDVVNVDTADTITLDSNAKFLTGAGSDIALAPNKAVRVCSDGTNWYQAAAVSSVAAGGSSAIDDLTDAYTSYGAASNFIMGRTSAAALTAGAQYNTFVGEGAGATTANSTNATDNNTATGYQALLSLTAGADNTAFGQAALKNNTSASNNTAVGSWALNSVSTAGYNTAVGSGALTNNTAGENSALGTEALTANTTGFNNTAVGTRALFTNVAKQESTAIGYSAMYYADDTATGAVTYNTALGAYALRGSTTAANNTGTYNTAIGHSSLAANTSGVANTAVGVLALNANTTGENNTALGKFALKVATQSDNTAIGANALGSTTTGNDNTAVGSGTLDANTTGRRNTALGYSALQSNKANEQSTAVGYSAMLYANDTTTSVITYNTAIGYEALMGSATAANNTGVANTALGWGALRVTTSGSYNTAIGPAALYANTTGERNVAIGSSGSGGTLSANTTGVDNVAIGTTALKSADASWNTAVGSGALANVVSNGTNTAVGYLALGSTTGGGNIAVGAQAGTMGTANTTGANNTFIGTDTGATGSGYQNATALGYQAQITDNNMMSFGNSSVTQHVFNGTGALTVPRGDTSQRPGTAVNGMLRYNSQSGKFEGYQAGVWTDIITAGGSPASPDRGVQFNSGGSFAAESTFTYTSTGNLGVGTTAPGAKQHVRTGGGTDATVLETLRIENEDTNTAGTDGIGSALTFWNETETAGTFNEAARIAGVFEDAANGSRDGQIRFYLPGPNAASGAASGEKMRLTTWGPVIPSDSNFLINSYFDQGTPSTRYLANGDAFGISHHDAWDLISIWGAPSGTADNAFSTVSGFTMDTAGNVGIGPTFAGMSNPPGALLHTRANLGTNSSILEALRMDNRDSDSAGVDGIGSAMTFYAETETNGTHNEFARIAGVADDAANASRDGSLRFYTVGPNATAVAAASERMRIDSSGNVGIGTSTLSYLLTLDGDTAARTIGMTRETTAATAGRDLTIQAGSAVSGGTNLKGGDVILSAGTGTGDQGAAGNIKFYFPPMGVSGTADRTPTESSRIGHNGLMMRTNVNNGWGSQIFFNGYQTFSGANSSDVYWDSDSAFEIWHNPVSDILVLGAAPPGTAGNSISFNKALTVDTSGNMAVGSAQTTLAPKFVVAPPASEAIAGAATITADACGTIKQITSVGNVTTNTTDTFTSSTASYAGCCMDIVNVDTADTITLDSNAEFATGVGTDIALAPNKSVRVCSDGSKWYQAAAVSSVAGGGTTTFVSLSDVPSSYTSQSKKYLRVNTGETAVEFTNEIIAESVSGLSLPTGMTLDNLSDVVASGAVTGDGISYNGSGWVLNSASTGAFLLPSGTAAQRPTAANGMMRYKTDATIGFEVREAGAWVAMGAAASDIRLKTEIEKLDSKDVLARLDQVQGYSYRLKEDGEGVKRYGVIAQELENVFPELVNSSADPKEMKSVRYLEFTALLIEASKELKAENDSLRTEVNDMKTQLASIDDLRRDVAGLKAHTGYGIGKAQFGIGLLAGMAGGGFIFFLVGGMVRNRKRNTAG